jgi:hypothetical protein
MRTDPHGERRFGITTGTAGNAERRGRAQLPCDCLPWRDVGSTINQTQALPVLPLTSNLPPAGWTLLKIAAGSVSAVTTAATTDMRPVWRRHTEEH